MQKKIKKINNNVFKSLFLVYLFIYVLENNDCCLLLHTNHYFVFLLLISQEGPNLHGLKSDEKN